jgi:cytochrome c oxidase cbb3-type subunit III
VILSLRNRDLLVLRAALFACAVIVLQAQNQPPAAPGNQNEPPPPGGAQDTRSPARRSYGGPGGAYEVADPAVLDRGRKTYQANCSFCHGANAKGGESGPNLVRSIVVLHDEHGNQIGQVVRNGRPDKGMPKFALTDAQISDLATFLHDQVRAAALRGTYQILNIVTGNAKQGEAYFNGAGGCSSCHSVTGDLAHIASKMEAVDLQQKIVMPRAERRRSQAAGPIDEKQAIMATVTLPSGETVQGELLHIDDFEIALTDSAGNYRSFTREGDVPKVVLRDPLQGHTDLLMKYTDADIHNLTAYLVTLK